MREISDSTMKMIISSALVAVAVVFMSGMYVQQGCHHCPKCPVVKDSVSHAPACTVLVDSSRIKIRDSIRIRTVRDTVSDTVPVFVEVRDTGKVAEIPDTTMSDGARIGATIRARLIVPPVTAAIRYTPAPVHATNWYFYDTNTVYKTSWTGITIGTLGGFVVGASAVGIFAYLITKD